MDTTTLWQHILTAPQDETLKAHYIQALAQADDRRAEIFRLAAELERFPSYYIQHEELSRQYESRLAEWREDFDTPARMWQAEVNFIQGWPIQITVAARSFLHHAEEIVATIPLRHLNLTAVQETPEVFSVAQWGQIASLDGSHQPWSSEAIVALADSPHLSSLRWLDLSSTGIDDTEVERMAASPRLKKLAHMDLRNNPCRDPVDAAAGCGVDGFSGLIVPESIWLPDFGRDLEARYGTIDWLHALAHFMERHPPCRYRF
jgi:hypothetical protein